MTFIIDFDANGGTTGKKFAAVSQDGKLTELPTAVRTSYSFDGWFTEAAGGTLITSNTEFSENEDKQNV